MCSENTKLVIVVLPVELAHLSTQLAGAVAVVTHMLMEADTSIPLVALIAAVSSY